MGLVSLSEVLEKANANGYAVGAFNFSNLEFLTGIIEAAVELESPIIVQTTEGAVNYAGMGLLIAMTKTAASSVKIPVALHLDHGKDMDVITAAIKSGYTGVMIDASDKPFSENLSITRRVVEQAHARGVSVEAELGRLMGQEDHIDVSERDAYLVDPDEAEKFARETGIDALAPAVGTAHGAFKYKGEACIDFERITRVKTDCGLPLVLHGASGVSEWIVAKAVRYGADLPGVKGVPDELVSRAIKAGVNKVNVDTDLRLAGLGALRQVLAEKPAEFDPRKLLGPVKSAVKEVVSQKINLFGSAGKGRT
ncbi:MAG: class II fructose-1,6-bisphosphate aldolase [Deltaproteobacteria bacterium]|nr:class II fructose-1,6-bisphosphate aldolase [Deltaproteobacteria bacterium]MBW2051596.1 class II fructose-1,6-bisphosphate aldolase [Deltaproteobacteria bacterium]MBW2140163.1 class II fructose-1,6-bisphosphate aldolase [Deltaproteobacteria bacterium]MBW2322918.1 class II fructose-1,6-bisphosphate aldolase [Deltaproteobacteria bacterium]